MSDDVIRIVVPGQPKAQERNRHRIVRPKGKAEFISNFLPAQTRNEQAVIRDFAKQAMAGRVPFEGAIDLRILACFAIPASWSKKRQQAAAEGLIPHIVRPDSDNCCKLGMDALKAIVWRDDSQVTDTFVWKRYSLTPQLIIEIRPL